MGFLKSETEKKGRASGEGSERAGRGRSGARK